MVKSDKELAIEHWEYTEAIILKMLDVGRELYVRAMVHGIKTGREEVADAE